MTESFPPGTHVIVRAGPREGSDRDFNGRRGVVVAFDPSLKWTSPRALLAPEQNVCVHFEPKGKREREHGSPMVLIVPHNLRRA